MAKGLRSNRGMALRAVKRATVVGSSWWVEAEKQREAALQRTVEAGRAAREAREAERGATAAAMDTADAPVTGAAPMDTTDGVRLPDPSMTKKERKKAAREAERYKIKASRHGRVNAQFYGKGHLGPKKTGKRMHKSKHRK
ncbi:hypothetical protein WJX72_007579 [[Myrmecia] bisecta]|uniref:Uncharacterized protein n=1 Tax=[Myrmecia] bisecta TaxID=41462 RepID=A0AAW1QFI3_9CHLO